MDLTPISHLALDDLRTICESHNMNYVTPLSAPPIGGPNLTERVAAELESRVLSGELQPGARLPSEPELGAMLHVSRTVVRAAVRTLVARGLLTVRQGHGTVVAEPTDAAYGEALTLLLLRSDLSMGDVMDARAAVEIQFGPLAAERGTQRDWETMERHLDRFGVAVETGEWVLAHAEHLSFHLALLRAVHLPALELLLAPMQEIIVRSSLPPSHEAIQEADAWQVELHPPILEALRAGNQEATRVSLRQHFGFVGDVTYAEARARRFREIETMHDFLSARKRALGATA